MKKKTSNGSRSDRIVRQQRSKESATPPVPLSQQSPKAKVMIRDVRTVLIAPPVDPDIGRAGTATLAHVLSTTYELATETQENLVAAYLDSCGRIIATERVYRGTIDRATVSTADALRTALLLSAQGIVLAHNHPSGNPRPSAEDIRFTRGMADAAKLLYISLIDHIIIAGDQYRSMATDGHLW